MFLGVLIHNYPYKNFNLLLAITFWTPPIVGIFLEGLLPNTMPWGRLVGFWITGTYTPASFILWSQTSMNVAGRTKKSVVQALVFGAWCLGFVVGPQAFQAKDAPQYRPGLYFCCAVFLVDWFILVGWYFWVRGENARRDQRQLAAGITPEQAALEGCLFGLQDMTDRQVGVELCGEAALTHENPHFRYRY